MLKRSHTDKLTEAGIDEAGRGCLAGPVTAAAVILPGDFSDPMLDDSKKLNEKTRYKLRSIIEEKALAFAVIHVSNDEIDNINILNASYLAMNNAVEQLSAKPQLLLVDGNRFINRTGIDHECIIKGDSKYQSIAAASILAKTYRDDFMKSIHELHPEYCWDQNKGYPTLKHKKAIHMYGLTTFHRKSFNASIQLKIFN